MLLGNDYPPDPRVQMEATILVNAGYKVTILGWDRDGTLPRSQESDGISVRRILVRSTHGRGSSQVFFLLLFWLKASWALLRTRCDAIHCHDFDTLPLGFLGARLKRVPLVYDSHESYPDMLAESVSGTLLKVITRSERWFLRRVDHVITVGERLARRLRRDGAARVSLVGNWKNPRDFAFSAGENEAGRSRLGIGRDDLVVAFIAHLHADRLVDKLLEAAAGMPGVFLLLGGSGALAPVATAYSEKYPNVRYLGFVPPSDVPRLTALADVVYYGFDKANGNAEYSAPNKLFEALAAGKALLTGDFGEIGEIVAKHRLGKILTSYDPAAIRQALSELRDDRETLREMQHRSRGLADSDYNTEKAEHVLKDIYGRLLSSQLEANSASR